MKKILITGGAGFIGSNFVHFAIKNHPNYLVVNFDKLTYAGNLANLSDLTGHSSYRFVEGDITDRARLEEAMTGADLVVNFAAETHVDRSIVAPDEFLKTNILGVQNILEAAKKHGVKKILHISTDEVYGSLPAGSASEDWPLQPNSPYAASKASADLIVRSYQVTFDLPVMIARPSNNYGPYQYPEKFIPLAITNILEGKAIPLYGDGQQVREWLHVEDTCSGLDLVLEKGQPGQIYNIGGDDLKKNIAVAQAIAKNMGKDAEIIKKVADRPGHDRRYALNSDKIKALGWRPVKQFDQSLIELIDWYRGKPEWWQAVKEKQARWFDKEASWQSK